MSITEDRVLVTLALAGVNCGTFETMTGREQTSSGDKYRPGPGQAEIAWGGPSSYSDIVVTRTWKQDRDSGLYKVLRTLAARAAGTVTETELDTDYNSFGDLTTWPVRLQGVKRPDVDINSGNKRMLEITLWVSGDPT